MLEMMWVSMMLIEAKKVIARDTNQDRLEAHTITLLLDLFLHYFVTVLFADDEILLFSLSSSWCLIYMLICDSGHEVGSGGIPVVA